MSRIHQAVQDHYAEIARHRGTSCCEESDCCETTDSAQLGYTPAELAALPEGADIGQGCGNPHLIAGIQPGETVLDLGSGAGIDCFLAAARVGPTGRVIGVDMTPEMITRATDLAVKSGMEHVEFRLGQIEQLPVDDACVDVVISNCVVCLSPDKAAVYREAFRVLRSGGRLAISDMISSHPIPPELRQNMADHVRCIAGAATAEDLHIWLDEIGFHKIQITLRESALPTGDSSASPLSVHSGLVEAIKP